MEVIGKYLYTKTAIAILLFISLLFAGDTKDDDISWDRASTEVDSFPFSTTYIDSVRDTLDCPVLPSPLRVIETHSAFAPETLVYAVSWGPFNAGYAIITTLHDSASGTIKVGAKLLSNNFVSAFYRMRDYIISTIDAAGLYPVLFEQHLREGKKYQSNEYLLFDHTRQKIHVKTRRNFKTVDSTGTFIHDYLSVLYYIRAIRRLAPGDTFSEQLFVHKKVHSIFFSVDASKSKEVEAGNFPCIILNPRLAGDGRAFNKNDKLEIWISNDKRHIPVIIRSKIKFGAIYAKLIWLNQKKNTTDKLAEKKIEHLSTLNMPDTTEVFQSSSNTGLAPTDSSFFETDTQKTLLSSPEIP